MENNNYKTIKIVLTKEMLDNIIYNCDRMEMTNDDQKLTQYLRECYKERYGEKSKW